MGWGCGLAVPAEVVALIKARAPQDVQSILTAFVEEALDLPRVRYELYYARGDEPTGIRLYVGAARFMNVFPGNSLQFSFASGTPDALPAVAQVGPEYVSLKVKILAGWLHDARRLRSEAYARIADSG